MVIKVDQIPAPGETVIGHEFVMAAGGKGANQAVAAARLGAEVIFVACLGNDSFGDRAVAGYEQEGIDTTWVVRDEEAASGVALIFVDQSGENSIAVASGANAHLAPHDVEEAAQAITSADALLIQLEVPLPSVSRAIELASEAGVPTILNPAPAQAIPSSLLTRVSIATPNEHEIRVVVGDHDRAAAVARMLDAGTQTVLVTLGSAGVLWAEGDWRERVPAFPVHAVDTTAAGDAFNGALACALARGLTTAEAIRYANAAAAITVTRMGAQPSLPTRSEVDDFLDQAGG
jgi:ribokinase